LRLQNKQYQGAVNQQRQFTAEGLTGMFSTPSGREVMVHQGGRRIGMTNAEIRDRVMAAASATPDQEQLLLNPDIPTARVRHLLGTTGRSPEALEEAFTNPTFEVRGSAATTPKTDVGQEFLEQQIGYWCTWIYCYSQNDEPRVFMHVFLNSKTNGTNYPSKVW
jgi:hypothetical protein